MATTTTTEKRSLSTIAGEIRKDWGSRTYFGARPYIEAMSCLDSIEDSYGCDDARGIVLYFLANAGTWRGETAKRIKAELKALAKR